MPTHATHPIVTRITLERLADQLDELQRIVWSDDDLDLRDRVDDAALLATVLLDLESGPS